MEAAFVCLLEAVLFWLLAAGATGNAALVRSIAALFAVGNVAHCVLILWYFAFPLPMVFDLVIAIGLAVVAGLA